MSSNVVVMPVLSDKVEDWKQLIADLSGPRSNDFADFNTRYQLTRHRAWLQQNPDGSYLALVLHEGEGASTIMQRLVASEHPFDVEFRNKVGDLHGIDFTQPPPPPPELWIDSRNI